jgi:hypothetical protein
MHYQRFHSPDIENLSQSRVEEIISAAKVHYTDRLPYHNWSHARATIDGVDTIAEKLLPYDITLAHNALRIAAAWHDAGYHENHSARGFTTKEDYSAALLDEHLGSEPIKPLFKKLMHSAITATWHLHPELRTPPQMVLHRADTANIGGPTDEFIHNNILLFQEAKIQGRTITWAQHVASTEQFVKLLAAEHDHESLVQYVDPEDSTIDVHNMPFRDAAFRNLDVLNGMPEPASQR